MIKFLRFPKIRYLLLAMLVAGCSSAPKVVSEQQTKKLNIFGAFYPAAQLSVRNQYDTAEMDAFVLDFVAKNFPARFNNASQFVNQTGLDGLNRLPPQRLVSGLGYPIRNPAAARPPTLDSMLTIDIEAIDRDDDIFELSKIWATLDITLARLENRDASELHWTAVVVRRNLLIEAYRQWFAMSYYQNQSDLIDETRESIKVSLEALERLQNDFEDETLGATKLDLFQLRSDALSLFQFYVGEQARLFNRTLKRQLVSNPEIIQTQVAESLVCRSHYESYEGGEQYVRATYPDLYQRAFANEGQAGKIAATAKLARRLATKALQVYHSVKPKAEEQIESDLAGLTEQDRTLSALYWISAKVIEQLTNITSNRLRYFAQNSETIYGNLQYQDLVNDEYLRSRFEQDIRSVAQQYQRGYLVATDRGAFLTAALFRGCLTGNSLIENKVLADERLRRLVSNLSLATLRYSNAEL